MQSSWGVHYDFVSLSGSGSGLLQTPYEIFIDFLSFKVAVNAIVPRSPFFSFCTPKCCRLQKKMRLDICVNQMQLLPRAVSPLTVVAKMEVSPHDEMANSQGMRVFAVEIYELPEDFVSFLALCGVQSSPLVFSRTMRSCVQSTTGSGTGKHSYSMSALFRVEC